MMKWTGAAARIFRERGRDGLRYCWFRMVANTAKWITRMAPAGDAKDDPTAKAFDLFVKRVNNLERPRILELGSRNISHRGLFTSAYEHVGFDINPGRNVDVVGDVHYLSRHFPADYFDAVYAVSVFEHLAMPWKAVVEINKVMKKGGMLFVFTHPTFPLHAKPWDFWRFSAYTFPVLLNAESGYAIEKCVQGLPCLVVPLRSTEGTRSTHQFLSFMGVAMLATKSAEASPGLAWDLDVMKALSSAYPETYSDDSKSAFFEYRDTLRK